MDESYELPNSFLTALSKRSVANKHTRGHTYTGVTVIISATAKLINKLPRLKLTSIYICKNLIISIMLIKALFKKRNSKHDKPHLYQHPGL